MKRTSIFLEEDLEHDLGVLARRQGRPKAALVREALERYVAAEKIAGVGRLAFVAVGHSGRANIAKRHEELLEREWSGAAPHDDTDQE